ncbi:hypothetical protein BDY24DRAFT_338473 [Mrakia frigida]|uniref:baculoviral IAP repeat-containing protein n=1 Tax=Mrakia frigida TaxID=29902 RepID=UPI003FCC056D
MEILSTRLSTFSASRTKKHNLPAHSAWPLSPSQYPRLLPALLAEAGWFYTPTKDDPDLVTCFLCGKQVGGWGEEDDPFEEHVGHQEGKCGWARTKCLVETRFTDPSDLPQSKALESARLSTFAKWWPHDKKKAWLPTSKNLAKAGFIFSPNGKGSDMASCLYCELGLDGWSPTDDPL